MSPTRLGEEFEGGEVVSTLRAALDHHSIEYREQFPVDTVTPKAISTRNGQLLNYDLLMLLPPFRGTGAVTGLDLTDKEGYIRVDKTMRVRFGANICRGRLRQLQRAEARTYGGESSRSCRRECRF